jgi:hypothetical protein
MRLRCKRSKRNYFAVLIGLLLLVYVRTGTAESGTVPINAPAQIGYLWTFEERHAKADLVVIAEPIATKDTGRRTVHPSLRPDLPVIELETELKVLTTLKGQSEPVIRLKHYRIDMDEWRRRNGAEAGLVNAGTHLSFDAPKERPPAYVLFLTATDGGRFEPLSGHTFPTETVFRLMPATELH